MLALSQAGDVVGWNRAPAVGELQYAAFRQVDASGSIVALDEIGSLDADIQQRVARPYSHSTEAFVYDEYVVAKEDPESGGSVEVYRVVKRPNLDRQEPVQAKLAPPHIAEEVRDLARSSGAKSLLLYGKLRSFPEWDVPLRTALYHQSPADALAMEESRSLRISERQALLSQRTAQLRSALESSGGKYVTGFHATGWVVFELPADRLEVLDRQLEFDKFEADALADFELGWDLGEGRQADRLDADRFIDAGYNGGQANSARHSFGRMTLAIIEHGMLEDEACMLYNGADCTGTSRLQERFECWNEDGDSNLCEPTADFPDQDNHPNGDGWDSDHATRMASIAVGDYTDNQACGFGVGDPSWTTGCHTNAWEDQRTGMAPEAALIFFGYLKDSSMAKYTDAIDDSIDRNVDVISASWMYGSSGDCNMHSSSIIEDEIEAAFDDGILPVFCAGNDSGATAPSCNLKAPGDTPKALSINPYNASLAACEADVLDCLLSQVLAPPLPGSGARGGLPVYTHGESYPLGTPVSAGADGVALIAPSVVVGVTNDLGSRGNVASSGGCSTATPHVAGMALLVKDWMVARGSTWINSPGRLSAVMLGMGDSHRANSGTAAATNQGSTGSNPWYGFGRPRLRLLENGQGMGPWSFWMTTATLYSSSSDLVVEPFGTSPLGAGTEIVKCSMQQHEDMSSKLSISDVDISVRLVNCSNPSQVYSTLSSNSVDPNTMVAMRANGYTLAGRCVQVTYIPDYVVSGGVTFSSWCYASGVNDDEEP